MKLLTVQDLSIWLRKSPATIRSDASRQPLSLPPICRLPGTKRLLWREVDVHQWIAIHVKEESTHRRASVDPDESSAFDISSDSIR